MSSNYKPLVISSPPPHRYYQYGFETTLAPVDDDEKPLPTVIVESDSNKEVISLKDLILNQLNKERPQDGVIDRPGAVERKSPSPAIEVCLDAENDENRTPVPLLDSLESLSSECSVRTPFRKVSLPKTGGDKQQTTPKKKKTTATPTIGAGGGGVKKEFKSKSSGGPRKVMSARYKTSTDSTPMDKQPSDSPLGHMQSSGIDFHNLYNHFECEVGAEKMEEKTNLFLYIDFHGHASKKGIFIYGNHMAHPLQAVECMLLPRLMSINSHHFHFDACNFSERNMYHK